MWRLCPLMISHAVQFLLCPSLFWTSSESHCTETHFTAFHIPQRNHDLDNNHVSTKVDKNPGDDTVILKGKPGLTALRCKAERRSKSFESKPKHSEANQHAALTKIALNEQSDYSSIIRADK